MTEQRAVGVPPALITSTKKAGETPALQNRVVCFRRKGAPQMTRQRTVGIPPALTAKKAGGTPALRNRVVCFRRKGAPQ